MAGEECAAGLVAQRARVLGRYVFSYDPLRYDRVEHQALIDVSTPMAQLALGYGRAAEADAVGDLGWLALAVAQRIPHIPLRSRVTGELIDLFERADVPVRQALQQYIENLPTGANNTDLKAWCAVRLCSMGHAYPGIPMRLVRHAVRLAMRTERPELLQKACAAARAAQLPVDEPGVYMQQLGRWLAGMLGEVGPRERDVFALACRRSARDGCESGAVFAHFERVFLAPVLEQRAQLTEAARAVLEDPATPPPAEAERVVQQWLHDGAPCGWPSRDEQESIVTGRWREGVLGSIERDALQDLLANRNLAAMPQLGMESWYRDTAREWLEQRTADDDALRAGFARLVERSQSDPNEAPRAPMPELDAILQQPAAGDIAQLLAAEEQTPSTVRLGDLRRQLGASLPAIAAGLGERDLMLAHILLHDVVQEVPVEPLEPAEPPVAAEPLEPVEPWPHDAPLADVLAKWLVTQPPVTRALDLWRTVDVDVRRACLQRAHAPDGEPIWQHLVTFPRIVFSYQGQTVTSAADYSASVACAVRPPADVRVLPNASIPPPDPHLLPDLLAREPLRIMGRTCLYPHRNGFVALKWLRADEHRDILHHEARMLTDLGARQTASELPRVHGVDDQAAPASLRAQIAAQGLDTHDEGGCLVYAAATESYWRYVAALEPQRAALGLRRAGTDLFTWLREGLLHTALTVKNHSVGRLRARRYEWVVDLCTWRDQRRGMGRLDRVGRVCRFANIRESGIADLAEMTTLPREVHSLYQRVDRGIDTDLLPSLAWWGPEHLPALVELRAIGDYLLDMMLLLAESYRAAGMLHTSAAGAERFQSDLEDIWCTSLAAYLAWDTTTLRAQLHRWANMALLCRQLIYFFAPENHVDDFQAILDSSPGQAQAARERLQHELRPLFPHTELRLELSQLAKSWVPRGAAREPDVFGFSHDGLDRDLGCYNGPWPLTELERALHVVSAAALWHRYDSKSWP